MKPSPEFALQPKEFWAHVRLIGQLVGYTERPVGRASAADAGRRSGAIKVPSRNEICSALDRVGLQSDHLFDPAGRPTDLGRRLTRYFEYRAHALTSRVEPKLL